MDRLAFEKAISGRRESERPGLQRLVSSAEKELRKFEAELLGLIEAGETEERIITVLCLNHPHLMTRSMSWLKQKV